MMNGEESKTTLLSHESTRGQKQIFLAANSNASTYSNSTGSPQTKIIIRTEEVVIVTLVLVLWVAAIALFFNRWGKIRMLEPYQPKFIQQHRASCPLVDQVQVGDYPAKNVNVRPLEEHRSFSKFNISGDACLVHHIRPRQNSVFVGSSIVTFPAHPPRKVKSAFDLKNLIISDPALNRSLIRLNNVGDDARRLSLRALSGANPESAAVARAADTDRRLSSKDLNDQDVTRAERDLYCIERDPTDGDLNRRSKGVVGEVRQSKSMSNHNSVSDSRHNSITWQDVRLTVMPRSERRSSLMPTQRDLDGASSFRRNSIMFVNSTESDRHFLMPRSETVKSGVVDFRRNSMLIISNLNEDIGIRPFSRNMSLGGSNVNLGGDSPFARRGSFIPPFCHDHKPKVSIPHVSVAKAKALPLEVRSLANQKPSKSLDSTEPTRHAWKRGKRDSSPIIESRRQFLAPVTVQNYGGSTTSLNCESQGKEKLMEESRSTGDLATEFQGPRIICPEEPDKECSSRGSTGNVHQGDLTVVTPVSLTASLTNINITSGIPMSVITSSGGSKKTSPVEVTHV